MSFEILPDELLLMVCSYLNNIDILQAFYNLNHRLNSTISDYIKKIDLIQVSYSQFNKYCHMLTETNLGLQLKSLSLSNDESVLHQLILLKKFPISNVRRYILMTMTN